jgi:hypothetical protein
MSLLRLRIACALIRRSFGCRCGVELPVPLLYRSAATGTARGLAWVVPPRGSSSRRAGAFSFTIADIPGRRSANCDCPGTNVILTGMRWAIRVKLPVALGKGPTRRPFEDFRAAGKHARSAKRYVPDWAADAGLPVVQAADADEAQLPRAKK